jgi:histidyl-tRNA synthetase
MKKANRINAKYILIAGTDEMEQNKITIKNFETGKQELLDLQEITEIIVNKNI